MPIPFLSDQSGSLSGWCCDLLSLAAADWSLREARSEIEFGYVEFDGKMFLLPIHAENSMVSRRGSEARNVVGFSNYRKFGAETTIQFQP